MPKRLGREEIRTKRNAVIIEHLTSSDTRFVHLNHVSGFGSKTVLVYSLFRNFKEVHAVPLRDFLPCFG